MYHVGSLACLMFFATATVVYLLYLREGHGKGKANSSSNNKRISKLVMTPSSIVALLKMTTECGLILLYIWCCENVPYSPHAQRFGTKTVFWTLFFIFIVFALATFKRNKNDVNTVLNRDQTEEWKGWMQYLFLSYHYFHEKEVYNAIRVFISCYVWMTGFGNVSFFYIKQDFGIIRFLQMMWRLNFLVVLLCITLDNTYILYYICPLHTFYFLTTYAVMRIYKQHNHSSQFILRLKFVCFGILVYTIWEFPVIFNAVWSFLPTNEIVGAQSGTRHEWHFRSGLDHYSAIFGMAFAINFPALVSWFARVEKLSKAQSISIKGFVIAALAIAFFIWARTVFVLPKLEYNQLHPYFFWVPLLFYVMVRNSSAYIRTFHSDLLAQMGKITLETYLLQHHIWLADNAKSRFILIPGYPLTNMCLTTAIYVYLSFRMFRITIGLRAMLIPNSKTEAFTNLTVLGVSFAFFYVISFALLRNSSLSLVAKVCVVVWTISLCASIVFDCFWKFSELASLPVTGDELADAGSTISSSVEVKNTAVPNRQPAVALMMIKGSIFQKLVIYLIGLLLMILAGSNRSDKNDMFDIASAHQASKLRDCTTALGTGVWLTDASTSKCTTPLDSFHGTMCFEDENSIYSFTFAQKNARFPEVQEACPSERPITHYSPKINTIWHSKFEKSTISIVGDSIARKMTEGIGRLVGHPIVFTENDRHKDKAIKTSGHGHEDIDINFFWRPMSNNVHQWLDAKEVSCSKMHFTLISIGAWHVRWDPESREDSLKYSLDDLRNGIRDLRFKCPKMIIGWMLPPRIEPLKLNAERSKNMTAHRYQRVLNAIKSSSVMNVVDFVLQADRITNNQVAAKLSIDGVHHKDMVYDVLSQTFANQILRIRTQNEKKQKTSKGANSLAGIAANSTIGLFAISVFILIIVSNDNFAGLSRFSAMIFGAGHTSLSESYRNFHAKNGISSS